jgi:hypothetical protein
MRELGAKARGSSRCRRCQWALRRAPTFVRSGPWRRVPTSTGRSARSSGTCGPQIASSGEPGRTYCEWQWMQPSAMYTARPRAIAVGRSGAGWGWVATETSAAGTAKVRKPTTGATAKREPPPPFERAERASSKAPPITSPAPQITGRGIRPRSWAMPTPSAEPSQPAMPKSTAARRRGGKRPPAVAGRTTRATE